MTFVSVVCQPQFGATYDDQLALALEVEQAGFDAFFRSDHYLSPRGTGEPGPTDAWVTLGALARETKRIRLGTLMTAASFRNPVLLAMQVAQVDQMSRGRVEFGVGAGWYQKEHEAMGIAFPSPSERMDRFEEQLQVLRLLWTSPPDQTIDHHGRHYAFSGATGLPKPWSPSGPRVIVGGTGPKRTPMIAARYADEYNVPYLPPDRVGRLYDRVRECCVRLGREPNTPARSVTIAVVTGASAGDVERRVGALGGRDALAGRAIIGMPDECVRRLREFLDVGAERLHVQLFDLRDLDLVRVLGAEVRAGLD